MLDFLFPALPLLSLLLLGWLLTSLILPWRHRSAIRKLAGEIAVLRIEVATLRRRLDGLPADAPEPAPAPEPVFTPEPVILPQVPQPDIPPPPQGERPRRAWTPALPATPPPPQDGRPSRWRVPSGVERQFGALLPVWIGGVALALAGFFLVKYSIETGLLSPLARVTLGGAFGLGLLWAGDRARARPDLADGVRIAQALTGAGLADLYVSLFAATTLYDLLGPLPGFAAMAAVTAAAVILSLRHGAPIALLGLIGGLVTPAMIHSDHPQAAPLFLYLYFVIAGLMTVIRRERWWTLGLPTVAGAFLWTLAWLFGGGFAPADAFWLGLFLIAVNFTVIILSHRQYAEDSAESAGPGKASTLLNILTMGSATLLMGAVASQSGFSVTSWGLFGLLAAGSLGLGFFNPRLYRLAPWLSLAVNGAMFLAWSAPPQDYAITLALFGALYAGGGYALQWRSANPLNWACLAITASLGSWLLGYFELSHSGPLAGAPWLWGGLALALALLAVFALQRVLAQTPTDDPFKQHMLAAYAGLATAFVALALTVELDRPFLPLAFAGQALALSWIATKVEIPALRTLVAALAAAFALLMAPEIGGALDLMGADFEGTILLQEPPLAAHPLLHLAAPALLFAAAAALLLRRGDGPLVRTLEAGAAALAAMTVYVLLRHVFHPAGELLTGRASFIERGVTSNALFALGLIFLGASGRLERRALIWSGLALCAIALLRIVLMDFLWRNPLWSDEYVGATPVANALLLPYGLPALWLGALLRRLPAAEAEAERWRRIVFAAVLTLAFTLITLNVRQIFHGARLDSGALTSLEVYAYSIAWLLLGLTLIVRGALRGDRLTRVAALAILLLTTGKVFLYDARELDGLYRVVSFFGLGVCLIGLSWFYARFVSGAQAVPGAGDGSDNRDHGSIGRD